MKGDQLQMSGVIWNVASALVRPEGLWGSLPKGIDAPETQGRILGSGASGAGKERKSISISTPVKLTRPLNRLNIQVTCHDQLWGFTEGGNKRCLQAIEMSRNVNEINV
jgi:hypothetical protein